MRVSSDMPDDVIVLHDTLEAIQAFSRQPSDVKQKNPLTLNLKNCGTALRFLEVHIEKCYPGEPITLTGDARLMERKGKPTSQTDSALLMHGVDIPVKKDESPYITMTRKVMEQYSHSNLHFPIEADWSSASYWYEYVAIHGGELLLEGLKRETIQGDKMVAQLYSKYFGVITSYVDEGAKIYKSSMPLTYQKVSIDFENTPDLYPAVAFTCEKLGITLEATGTERLKYKESNRLTAVRRHEVHNDHRIAMALMAADFPVSVEEQECIKKSYPNFVPQHITPIRGVNDDNLGKKHALSRLIHNASSDYVWMHDDDVVLPKAASHIPFAIYHSPFDLIILPLRMESQNAHPSLLERLQMAEYAAIQELTVRSAKRGRAVMCSGANLLVRRETWLACEADLHPEIPSGDDIFLLEAMKRKGYRVGVLDEPDYTAIVRPLTSWRAFWRQRMRWAGKAPKMTDKDIRRCGIMIVTANILQVLCPLIILVKFPIEYGLIRRREPQTAWPVALLLEVLYPFYMLICLVGGLFRREW